jgi:hypothetical protein
MKKFTFCRVVLMSMACTFAGSAFATPISATLMVQASATASGEPNNTQVSTDTWGIPLSALNAQASALSVNTLGSVSVFGSAAATWAPNGLSGSVSFENYGWSFIGTSGSANLQTGADWTFSFIANGNGEFSMNYDVVGNGDKFGLWGWNININGSDYLTLNPNDPTASGFITEDLVDGEIYTISLINNANISVPGNVDTMAGNMSGLFNWTIRTSGRPVPEPSSLLLLAIGLACLRTAKRISV